MKNLLVFFICMYFIGYAAQSQSFGVKGGLNLSTVGGDAEGASSKAGIHFGGFAQFGLTKLFKLQPELIYSQQGANLDDVDDAKAKYNYINVPVIAKFHPGGGPFNIQAGLQTGVLLSAEVSVADVDVDVKEDLETLDFSLAVGIGFDISKVVIDARFIPGLTTTAEGPGDDSFPNQNIQLSVGVKF